METDDRPIQIRNADVTWRQVDGEIVVLDRRTWAYLSINASGAVLWPLLVAGTCGHELVSAIREAFGLDAERAAADVAEFLAAMGDRGLLVDAP